MHEVDERYDTFSVLMKTFLITTSVHIVVSLTSRELLANVYLLHVLSVYDDASEILFRDNTWLWFEQL